MQPGKLNVLLDGFWGSSGKGKMSTALCHKYDVHIVSSANFPNAGHTAIFLGRKFIAKAIPTAAILPNMVCLISPGSGFTIERLREEASQCEFPAIYIHDRASIVLDKHRWREQEAVKHIASTMQGSGAALCDKIMRDPNVVLARDVRKELEEIKNVFVMPGEEFRGYTQQQLLYGETILHEGSQGYALSVDHGSHFPHCTSRNCDVQSALSYMAVAPRDCGDVYLNLRTFPIRVGSVEGGYSGDFYDDCEELTWEEVARRSGMPESVAADLAEKERTTVTKRIRRVCTFSWKGLKDAVRTNGATKICLNFVQYLDWNDYKKRQYHELSRTTRDFVLRIEKETGVEVVAIGTGEDNNDIVWSHG